MYMAMFSFDKYSELFDPENSAKDKLKLDDREAIIRSPLDFPIILIFA